MAKITLDVDDKNLKTVLNILENLKTGLIKSIDTKKKQAPAKPVSSSLSNNGNKKYLSKNAYKEKLNQKVEEDEFFARPVSTSKYVSPEAYKKRLKG